LGRLIDYSPANDMTTFDPNDPYDALPLLPPKADL
jgi:hypothetical protein